MPSKRLDALTAIASLIAPEARRTGDLARAWGEPEAYIDDHARELDPRGITEPVDHLPWVALALVLADADALAELGGAADAEAVRRAIERLGGCPRGAFAWMKHDAELAERSTDELVELTGKALHAKGVQLVELGGESLGRCLAVVAEARAAELVKLVRTAGFGEVQLITGAGLIKATKDRAAAARHAAQQSSREAGRPAATAATRYFARGKESWTLDADGAGWQSCYEKPRVKYYVHHQFDDAAAARAGLQRQVAEWTAAGFHEIDHAAWAALPHADAPYINWTAPFPDDASYVVEGKEIVRCTQLAGDSIIELAGTIGYNFGERQTVVHCKTTAAASRRYAEHVAADAHFPAIARAELVKRYR